MDLSDLGKWLLVAGIVLALVGAALGLLGRGPGLGRLPGDLTLQWGNVSCFVPIATMLLLSLLLTVILNIVVRLLNR